MARVGRRFREALDYAATLPRKERGSKGGTTPHGFRTFTSARGGELGARGRRERGEAIAGSYDAIEDQRCEGLTERENGERYGAQVLEIVKHCTKAEIDETGPAEVVKARRVKQTNDYVEHLRGARVR